MLNLKKTAVAVLAFGSSAVFAGTMGPVCAPGNVTVPCEATAWDFGVQALYLEQAFDNSESYYSSYFEPTSTVGDDHHHRDSDRWGWGFQLEGSYHFGTGNDVDLNWYHMSRNGNHHHDTYFYDVDVNGRDYSTKIKPQWDAVNLEFGQHVDFSQTTKARFHAGAQYARVKSNYELHGLYPLGGTLPLAHVSDIAERTETYNGFGPRAGTDLFYEFGNGFAVYGKAAVALLAGSNKINWNYVDTGLVRHSWNRSRSVIVPELEGKLGAKYTYAMASGDLTLDVGYMWVDYLNVKSSSLGTSDFGLDGIYFGAKWVGNVA